MQPTPTSISLIKYLEKEGISLTKEQKNHIHKSIYDSIVSAYAEGKEVQKRGCDCGQMWCPICS